MRRYKKQIINTANIKYNHETRELTIKNGDMAGTYKDTDTYSAEVIIALN